jgi:hypothetical protein
VICPLGYEAEVEDDRSVFTRQRALRFHAAAEFLVEPLNRVRGALRFPAHSYPHRTR